MTWKDWFLFFLFLNALDCHSTLLVLNKYGSEWEFMPWVKIVFINWGAVGIIALKILFLSLYYGLIRLLLKIAPQEIAPWAVRMGLMIACGLLAFVVILNYYYAFQSGLFEIFQRLNP